MPNFTEIATLAAEGVVCAAINHSVSLVIAPFVGPVGAALAPRVLALAAPKIATSATASVITYGIFACSKAIVNNTFAGTPKTTNKSFNEDWDDADHALNNT